MARLNVKVEELDGGITLLTPNGDIDSETADVLKDALDKAMAHAPRSIVVDMGGAPYISSVGLGVFFDAMKRLKNRNAELVMCNLRATARRIFDMVRVVPADHLFASVDQAKQYASKLIEKNKQLQL